MTETLTRSAARARGRGAHLWLALSAGLTLPALAAVSCGGEAGSVAGTDTSTNWLSSCESEADCGLGSTCSCGRCTRECEADADCARYSSLAACVATSGRCAEARLCMLQPAELGAASAGSSSCTHPANDYSVENMTLCFGRELPECPPGSTPFVDACGCGCSAAPDYPRRCRDRCELAAGECEQRRFEDFPDYEATRESWLRNAEGGLAGLVAGECGNGGRRFLYTANGTTSEGRVFTADGSFLGLGTTTDDVDMTCWGAGYWPEPTRCDAATVTEVLSERLGLGEVGQGVTLPWGEGPPEPLF